MPYPELEVKHIINLSCYPQDAHSLIEEKDDKEAIDKAMETLAKTSEPVVTKLYQAASEQAKQTEKPDVEVKDADAEKAE